MDSSMIGRQEQFVSVRTHPYTFVRLDTPVIYVLNERSVQLVWQEMSASADNERNAYEPNVDILTYNVYRDQLMIAELDAHATSTFGFIVFTDEGLQANTIYSDRVEASGAGCLNSSSSTVSVQTSPATPSCQRAAAVLPRKSGAAAAAASKKKKNAAATDVALDTRSIWLLDVLEVNFKTIGPRDVSVSYAYGEWKALVACLSASSSSSSFDQSLFQQANSYSRYAMIRPARMSTAVAVDNFTQMQLDNAIFSMKILVQRRTELRHEFESENDDNDLHSIDFPYPESRSYAFNMSNDKAASDDVQHTISGLSPSANYSFRISFQTQYPNRQIHTTGPVYLQTFADTPCCDERLAAPTVVRQPVIARAFAVRWPTPTQANGLITHIRVHKARLVVAVDTSACQQRTATIATKNNQLDDLESFNLALPSALLALDRTNRMLVFHDTSVALFTTGRALYVYRVELANELGSVSSAWSEPCASMDLTPPAPPSALTIDASHSTGFRVKFRTLPLAFADLLSHYTVRLEPLVASSGGGGGGGDALLLATREFVVVVDKCNSGLDLTTTADSEASVQQQVAIGGLEPFKSYKVSAYATSTLGSRSVDSESIIANTLESTPRSLRPLRVEACMDRETRAHSILFKFDEPQHANGLITAFNLYRVLSHVDDRRRLITILYTHSSNQKFIFKHTNERIQFCSDRQL